MAAWNLKAHRGNAGTAGQMMAMPNLRTRAVISLDSTL